MAQQSLDADPFANVGNGVRYLRLTNDCPKEGYVVRFESAPEIQHNDVFDKDEYHWPITQWTPAPLTKIITESSIGFRASLKQATAGNPYGKILQITWRKVPGTKGKVIKEWSIVEVRLDDIPQIFGLDG